MYGHVAHKEMVRTRPVSCKGLHSCSLLIESTRGGTGAQSSLTSSWTPRWVATFSWMVQPCSGPRLSLSTLTV